MIDSNCTDAPRDSTKSTRRRLRGAAVYAVYLIFSVTAIVLLIELALAASFWITGKPKLLAEQKERSQPQGDLYPQNPDDFIKIAVFGGSAAQGMYSPRGFDEVIEHELRRRFPNLKFFIKNYALAGYPFHRHQAEYVKRLISKYDFILIYCGNNEAENWYDDSGYWRLPEYKDSRDLTFVLPEDAESPAVTQLRRFARRHSRLYALTTGGKEAIQDVRNPIFKNRNWDYEEFQPRASLPVEARAEMVENFERDVVEIAQLAEQHESHVLLAAAVTLQTWPPCYSVLRDDMTAQEKQRWQELYLGGMEAIENGDNETAKACFLKARQIDDGAAILDYRLGMTCLRLGDHDEGRKHLRRATDLDGYVIRSISSLRDSVRKLGDKHSNLHEVDVLPTVDAALQEGLSDNDIFVDVNHPSFVGHVMIGWTFLARLVQLEPFPAQNNTAQNNTAQNNTATSAAAQPLDWLALAGQFEQDLGITDFERQSTMVEHVFWYFDLAHFTAYPNRCYDEIEKILLRLESGFVDPDRTYEAFALASRARLALIQEDRQLALEQLNKAHSISPTIVLGMMRMKAWNHYIQSEFDEAEIRYSSDQRKFVLQRIRSGEQPTD